MFPLLLLSLAATATASSATRQSFLREPFDQIATVGEHVTLPCRVSDRRGVLQWTRDDFGLGSDRRLDGFSRYTMTGSDDEGDYTLDINPVSLEDDARFQCQVGAAEEGRVAPIRSRYATVTVLVPPEPPVIVLRSSAGRELIAGDEVELRCESRGGKPASEITWLDESNSVIADGTSAVQELMADGKRFNSISTLRFTARAQHDGANFTCQAQNSANRQPQSTSIRLTVHYPPILTLTSKRERVLEGDSVRFRCAAESSASDGGATSFTWFVGGRRVRIDKDSADSVSEFTLESADRRLNGHMVKCEAENAVGRSDVSVVLDVSYPPVFLSRPENRAGQPGDRVTLRCNVDSNPSPSYLWHHTSAVDGKRRLVGNSANLTLLVNTKTAGEYECVADADGHNAVAAKAMVHITGPPVIVNGKSRAAQSAGLFQYKGPASSTSTQLAQPGETGFVVCEAFSVPEADIIEWSFKGRILDPREEGDGGGGGRHSTVKKLGSDGAVVRSTLVIKDVAEEDFGAYGCKVANVFGSTSAVILLRKQTSMPLLVILSGILGGLILTVAVIMTVVLCRKSISNKTAKSSRGPKTASDLLTIKPMSRPPSGSDDDEIAAANGKAPSSTATSTSDELSNNSSDITRDVNAPGRDLGSIRLGGAGEYSWEHHGQQQHDFVDGGNVQQYYNNLVQASNDYFGKSSDVGDSSRYSVHIRESPRSPMGNGSGITVKGYGPRAAVNTSYDYVPASAFLGPPPPTEGSGGHHHTLGHHGQDRYGGHGHGHHHNGGGTNSSSTMPRAGFARYPESYSVYVDGPSKGGYRHEVMVPMHEGGAPVIPRPEGSTGSSATKDSANSSSLATHV